jgi:hypothetical protein
VNAAALRPISSAPSRQPGRRFSLAFCSVLFVAGAVMGYFLALRPMLGVLAARHWSPTPCAILSSEVRQHPGSDGTTYSVNILYAYEAGGREFRSDRARFLGGSSSGRRAKEEFVRRYPAGAQATCYVNPRDPAEAVLERGFTGDMWIGLVPLLFMLAGAVGIISVLRRGRNAHGHGAGFGPVVEPMSVRSSASMAPAPRASGPVFGGASESRVLKSSQSRLGAVLAIGGFAVIWNSAIWFGFLLQSGWFNRGRGDVFDWVTMLFMIPFVLVGLGMIVWWVYVLLGFFNPKAVVTITPGAPALGEQLTLAWQVTGRTHVLRGLKIFLEAREEATYRRGTRTHTDKKTFLKLDLHAASSATEIAAGQASVTLPADTLPTWQADNNRIVWAIHVTGDIPRWPDLKEEFVIEVRAPRPEVSA